MGEEMRKAKAACPRCGESWRINVRPVPATTQASVDRPREVCAECGLPVSLWDRIRAAMECARRVLDSFNSGDGVRMDIVKAAKKALGGRRS